jgi:hypothetical protein
MRPKKKYSVSVSNIGNIDCDTRKIANATFKEYRRQSREGYGRAADEDVTLFVDGEVVSEFIGDSMGISKGTFRRLAWSYIRRGPDAVFQVITYQLIKDAGGSWEVNDSHTIGRNLEPRECLDLVCEQWELFKIRYCRKAKVKDVREVSEQPDALDFEVRQIPFLVIRLSDPET